MAEEPVNLRVELEGDMKKKFLKLKQKLGFENNTDLVRFLITRGYENEFKGPLDR